MIRRLYIHNFRCLENFDLPISGLSSALLIGRNGTGKTTLSVVLEIFQRIGRGTNRVGELVKPQDFPRGRTGSPMRFELEVELRSITYNYVLVFELPEGFKELRVFEETLMVGKEVILSRNIERVKHIRTTKGVSKEATLTIDWHLVALPILQVRSENDPLFVFKRWLSQMLILRPIPSRIDGDSVSETLEPAPDGHDFAAWFSGLISYAPSAYGKIEEYLRRTLPDLQDIKNPHVGAESRSLIVQFATQQENVSLPLKVLSDGEKCYMICALVLASNHVYGPLLCFWDEPDNHLALSEVGDFVVALRKSFRANGGQFIASSHNSEAIERFSEENTIVLDRRSHLEPTVVRPLSQMETGGGVVSSLLRDSLTV